MKNNEVAVTVRVSKGEKVTRMVMNKSSV